ncbi:MAG: SDR family oxidoreductase [Dehalococcoidales bacterium]|nr:SDR family oxidoreductase [Dehalococcoidales bacterium]
MRLEGKTAIVTGGGTGIGAATAKKFALEGAKVLISGRRKEKLDEVAAACAEGTVVACQGDVTSYDDVKRMVATALEFGGKLDILVNNAGTPSGGGVVEMSLEEWQKVLDINLTGPVMLMRESIPHMIKNGSGSIINIASLAGKRCIGHAAGYCATKAAIIHLSKQVALDYSPQGVRCNVIYPGPIKTDMAEGMAGMIAQQLDIDLESAYRHWARNIPIRRAADPSEVANLCCFLASDEASFITGTEIAADGGASVVDVMGIGA